jgi:O-antigen/teichoic acid export membrane protein
LVSDGVFYYFCSQIFKLSSLRSFFKDTLIYGVAAILPRVVSLLLVRIHTGVFEPSQYSDNTVWYVYAAYFNVLLTLGLETSFFRFFTGEKEKEKVISTAFIILLCSASSFFVTGMIFSDSLAGFFQMEIKDYFTLLLMTVALDTLVVIPFAYLRVTGRPFYFLALKTLNIVFLLFMNMLLLWIVPKYFNDLSVHIPFTSFSIDGNPKIIYIFFANLLASFFTLLCLLPFIIKIKWTFDRDIFYKFLHYGLPIMIGGLAFVTNENLDKIFIEQFSGKEANGIYAACYKLGVFMTLYVTAFRMGAEPFFFNHAGAVDAKEKYSTIMSWFVIFGTICMLIVVAFMDIFAGLLIGDESYFTGLYIVPVLLLANLFSGIYNNLSVWYKLTDRTRMGMYISLTGAAVTIAFLFLLVPVYGFSGAAWTTMIAYGSMMIISYFMGSKYYPVPYDIKKIAFYITLSTVLCLLSYHFTRQNILINLLIVAGYLIFVFYRENLLAMIFRNNKISS